MQETIGAAILLMGLALIVVGHVWLLALAIRTSLLWGILGILTLTVGLLAFGATHFRTSKRPLLLVLIGLLLGAVPFAYGRVYEILYGLGERERVIDGERHLVLTGWDRDGYDILSSKKDLVVLEMGNRDVTDSTLEWLRALPDLRELTLNDSSITDAGLATLRELPSLESLRLARTKISKDGLAKFLDAPPPKLKELDVSGNNIPTSTLRKWKNGDPEHRRYVN